MSLTRNDESELLTALYEGAFDQPLWATFLTRLRLRAKADHAGIIFRSNDDFGFEIRDFYSGLAAPDDVQRSYMAELYRLDPIPYGKLKTDRVYSLSEFLDVTDLDHARYHKEFLEPAKISHLRLIRVTEPSGTDAWCFLSREARDFPASTSALLSALAPHLKIAVRGFVAIQHERFRATISTDIANRLNFGWMTLDAAGHVIDIDGHAEQLLQRSSVLRRTRQGRLLPALPQADRILSQILRTAHAPGGIRPCLINLRDDPWFDMLVIPVVADTPLNQARPVMTIYIQGDAQPGAKRCDHLMALFNLSEKEAQLALALSRGRTIAEAAVEIGITTESARTYSKRVYAKTSTRGQSDLIPLILASVIALT